MNQPGEQPTIDGSHPRAGLGNPPEPETFPNEVIRNIFERRTIRRFLGKPIPGELLDLIVSVGLHSANAGGCQAPIFLVSQDHDENGMLGRISNDLYVEGYYPVSESQPSTACQKGMKDAFYGAPVVITVFTPVGWEYAPFDASIAVSNMMSAAWSLGLGSCFVSRAKRTFGTLQGKEVMDRHGIPDDYEAQLHVVLGYPESTARDDKPLYPNRVAWAAESQEGPC